jgi:signal peptidase I
MARKTETEPSQIAETVKTIVWAAVIAVVIRTFAYEPFSIPSGSMVPTLLVGDYLFVSKTAYGYSRYSFPWGIVPVEGRIWEDKPERGDVIVFRPPGDTQTDFIKRLIGLPGDTVQVKEGLLYINGEPVKRQRIEDFINLDSGGIASPQYIETLPGGVSHRIIELSGDRGRYDNTPVFVVPDGHYFMMGDNRDSSSDSRVPADNGDWLGRTETDVTSAAQLGNVGFVPAENLIGPAKVLFWSYDNTLKLTNPITWVTALRWRRLADLVE